MAKKGQAVKRPRGRPPLPPGQGKRASFTTRLSNDLKQKLEAEAHAVGRSLSEEIETRLANSLRDPNVMFDAVAGGNKNASFFRIIGLVFGGISQGTSADSVWDRPQAFVEAADAMRAFFDYLAKGRRNLSKGATSTGMGAEMGRNAAKLFLGVVTTDYDDVVRRAERLGGKQIPSSSSKGEDR